MHKRIVDFFERANFGALVFEGVYLAENCVAAPEEDFFKEMH
jgi:hypothetical protein